MHAEIIQIFHEYSNVAWVCLSFQGVSYPCNHAIWSKWSPVSERSTLVTAAIAGTSYCEIILSKMDYTVGTKSYIFFPYRFSQLEIFFALPVTGLLCKYGFDGGWPTVFYFFGKRNFALI